ncbi:MAG: hypothetical protein M0R32_09850 [Candidatus Cloacimonetes bacterium]|jgi:hypothetical protein|nr:hypothetical protein [Candidatus Cloacimonadota bacterium]
MSKTNVKKAPKAKKPEPKHFSQPSNFDSILDSEHLMESEGLFVGLNMPPAISSSEDIMHGLPPYKKRKFYAVDEFPGCPSNWVASRGKSRSYFVPVLEGSGMWLDFNKNCYNDYHVAVVVSVQGVNAITGLMTSDEHLEQYIEKCPKHDVAFGPSRFCEKCGYHWPKQNYLSTTATPNGKFWLDGFRAADGAVRQYILTAEKMRGVASNVIGEERVFAIGLSFFLSKNKKPQPVINTVLRSTGYHGGCFGGPGWNDAWSTKISEPDDTFYFCSSAGIKGLKGAGGTSIQKISSPEPFEINDNVYSQCCSTNSSGPSQASYTTSAGEAGAAANSNGHLISPQILARGMVKAKNLEVGAGAKIRQQIYDDPESLDFWRDESSAIICINYVLETDASEIFKRGRLDLSGSQDGFLQGIPVGN